MNGGSFYSTIRDKDKDNNDGERLYRCHLGQRDNKYVPLA